MLDESQLDQLCEALFLDRASDDTEFQDDASCDGLDHSEVSVAPSPTRQHMSADDHSEFYSARYARVNSLKHGLSQTPRTTRAWLSWITLFCLLGLAAFSASLYQWGDSGEAALPPLACAEESCDYETVAIETIQAGDVVYAFNPETEQLEQRRVVQVFHRTAYHLRLLDFVDEAGTPQRIETTDEHPFWVVEQADFVAAKDLTLGDTVQGPAGELQQLTASVREEHPEGVAVYNFEVEGLHDYYVLGKETRGPPVLVHNTCVPKPRAQKGGVHKNSLDYVGETHVYRVRGPNGTYKIGESARGTRISDGASLRAEQQARRLQRSTGDVYETQIRKTFPDKRSAREYETKLIDRFRRMFGDDKLPGNKTNR